jgi:hypothetical protein
MSWTKVYQCFNPTGKADRYKVTARVLGNGKLLTGSPNSFADPPHQTWAPANPAYGGGYSTYHFTSPDVSKPGPNAEKVAGGGNIVVGWRVVGNVCQLCDLRWNVSLPGSEAVNPWTELLAREDCPGGGIADRLNGNLVVAVDNANRNVGSSGNHGGDPDEPPHINVDRFQFAIAVSECNFSQLTPALDLASPKALGLDWHDLRAYHGHLVGPLPQLPDSLPEPWGGLDPAMYQPLHGAGAAKLRRGEWTALAAQLDPGQVLLLRGGVPRKHSPHDWLLCWVEQIDGRDDGVVD